MANIINNSFTVGQRFRGVVNGHIFRVTQLVNKGDPIVYHSPWGPDITYQAKDDTVYFLDETTGQIGGVGLRAAKCLLFEPIEATHVCDWCGAPAVGMNYRTLYSGTEAEHSGRYFECAKCIKLPSDSLPHN